MTRSQKNTKFYLMANIFDEYILQRLDERRKVLLNGKLPKKNILHITLLQFEINDSNPNSNIFQKKDFLENIRKFYDETFGTKNVKLEYSLGMYDLLGQSDKKFYVKKYCVEKCSKNVITNFRKKIYKYLETKLGKETIIDKKIGEEEFKSFCYQGQELFCVPKYYYGSGVWEPHISIVNTEDIKLHNDTLFKKYQMKNNIQDQLGVLLNPILKKQFQSLGHIYMGKHIGDLIISLKNKNKSNDFKI